MTSAPAIGFEYRPSRLPPRVLTIAAMAALLAVALCALPLPAKLLLVAAVLLALWQALANVARSPVAAAGWSADGWTLRLSSHEDVPATLASFRVWGAFVLLRLRAGSRVHVLLLAADNSDADIRRRLRMRLATGRSDGEPTRP